MNAMSVGGTGAFLFPTSTRTAKTGARNMADEQTQPTAEAEQQPQDAAPTGAEPGNQTEQARTFSQADIDRIVTERLAKEKAKSEAAVKRAQEEAEAKRLAEQGEFQKLYEQAQAKLQEAEERARALELAGIRRDVAARLNLPAALMDRLRGEDEAAIEADAKALIAALPKPAAPDINAGSGTQGSSKPQSWLGGLSKQEFAARFGVKAELLDNQ